MSADLAERVRALEVALVAHEDKCGERNLAAERRWDDNNARLARISRKIDWILRWQLSMLATIGAALSGLAALAVKFLL